MPAYRYRAVHPSGRIHRGEMAAANENELIHILGESGLELLEARAPRRPAPHIFFAQGKARVGLRERALFCRQIADLLRAGLPFMEALQGVITALLPGPWRNTLDAINRNVQQGSSIAAAFSLYPHLFNPVFIALLKTGEASGDLPATFDRLAHHAERQANLREQVSRVLRYPLFLLCVAIGVTVFMMTAVVPQVMEFLNTLAQDLPFLTRLLIGMSALLVKGWWAFALIVGLAAVTIMLWRKRSAAFAQRSDGWLFVVPGLGPILRQLALARFAYSFALLMQSGADLPGALRIAKDVLGNRVLIAEAIEAERQIQAGQAFSVATGLLFPPHITQRIRVGEQSGRLVETLTDIARIYDSDTKAAIDHFIGALEPALTLLVGALLAWVVLAVLGPVYGSLSQLNLGG